MSEPDELTALLRRRATLIHQTLGELAVLAERFITELTTLDAEIGTQQRHNVQQTTAATLVVTYRDLQKRIEGGLHGASERADELATLLTAMRAQVDALQGEVRGLVEREQARGSGA